jgi:predicted ATPase/class 3 adenylate cyclase
MIDRIVAALRELGLEPTADDVRDAIWLALQMQPERHAETTPRPGTAAGPSSASKRPIATGDSRPAAVIPPPEPAVGEPEKEAIHLPAPRAVDADSGVRGVAVSSPGVPSLPDALGISRALRPLMRRVPSRSHFLVDERATVDRIVDEGLWLPVVRPGPSRWLDLALIVDEGASMPLWRSTIAELQALLERHGAFRDVRTWSLVTDARDKQPALSGRRSQSSGSSRPSRSRNPLELVDPAGQRLLLIVSDCVSPAWRSGQAGHLVARWGRAGPVAVLQMLPERLWPGTGLAAEPALFQMPYPGAPNSRLVVRPRSPWPSDRPQGSLPVPVIALEPKWIAPWAKLMAGSGVDRFPGSVAYVGGAAAVRQQLPDPPADPVGSPPATAEERVLRFRATASPLAVKLAGHLAAAPLTLPVMRLIQEATVPNSTLAHLAEVFLSGLIERRTPATAPVPSDGVQYDFAEGVRDLLLNAVLRTDAMFVLRRVGDYLERRNEISFGFSAILADPNGSTAVTIDARSQPFAVVAANVLHRLGGRYEGAAELLEERVTARERIITVRPQPRSPRPPEPPPQPRRRDRSTCPNCGYRMVEPARFCLACGTPLDRDPSRDELKIVTAVFCDVVRSTDLGNQLGSQSMQRLMDRYSESVRRTLSGHGARVSKRRGDGFMAAFGVPAVREDDALRAVRAVTELRQALGELAEEVRQQYGVDFDIRVGVNTGNVLVRDAGTLEEELTGPPVNLAKRIEEAAGPGEILLGETTFRLVADMVRAEPAGPLEIKGTVEPQNVWRLREAVPALARRARQRMAPFVGRELERELLLRLFERTVAEQSAHLVTVVGSAGVGKTRLVDEFVADLGNRAQALRTFCLPFQESVSFAPMVEIVRQAAGLQFTDGPELAMARLNEVLDQEDRGALASERLGQLLGFRQDAGLSEDTMWAVQRLLEALARRRPLILVIDDLQWADPLLLDALEHIVEHAAAVPLMVICMARPDELFSHRPNWPSGRLQGTSIRLSPLSQREGEELVVNLLGGRVDRDVQAHLNEWAQGFPLLVEELISNLREEGQLRPVDGSWTLREEPDDAGRPARTVPASIQALLLARLDRLSHRGRAVIEPAAIVGQQFHLGDLEALHIDASAADLTAGLQELVRLDIIRPDPGPPSMPLPPNSGPGYRFRHATIKTVAYERLPDDRRAELHERYADWLERVTEDRRSQFDELIGHHFHEAYRYASKLDPGSDRARKLARRAGERYAEAGQRAAVRGDTRLVQAWLGQAVRLLPAEHALRLRSLPALAEAQQAGGQLAEAMRAYQELAQSATAVGDERLALHATIGRLGITAMHDPGQFLAKGRDQIELAIAAFHRLDDRLGLAKAWHLLAYLDWTRGHLTQAKAAAERAAELAREAGDTYWESNAIGMHCLTLYWGPAPLDEVEQRSREALDVAERSGSSSLAATAYRVLTRVAAHRGDLEDARRYMDAATAISREEGALLPMAVDSISRAMVELLAGDLAAAEEVLRNGYRQLEEMGATSPRVSVATLLARVLLLRGRVDEAEQLTRTCERLTDVQVDAQAGWRSIRAIAMARRGELEEAEQLARRAVHLTDMTDQPDLRAQAQVDLAEVLLLGRQAGEAAQHLELAILLYGQKGIRVGVRNAREQLARLTR